MKKILAIVLSVAMLLSLMAISSFAEAVDADCFAANDGGPSAWLGNGKPMSYEVTFNAVKPFTAVKFPASWGPEDDFTVTVSVAQGGAEVASASQTLKSNPGALTFDFGKTVPAGVTTLTVSLDGAYFVLPSVSAAKYSDKRLQYPGSKFAFTLVCTEAAADGVYFALINPDDAESFTAYTEEQGGIGNFWLSNDTCSPEDRAIHPGTKFAAMFRTTKDIFSVGVPQFWASNPNNGQVAAVITMKLYAFDVDYATTVAGTPVAVGAAVAPADNKITDILTEENCKVEQIGGGMFLTFAVPAAAGQYVLVVTEDATESGNHYLVLTHNNVGSTDDTKWQYFTDDAKTDSFSLRLAVATSAQDPFAPLVKATDLVAFSFDSFYENGALSPIHGGVDGAASKKLNEVGRKIDGTAGNLETISIRGWIGYNEPIAAFGYVIGDAEPVYGEFAQATEDPVKNAGGKYASRFCVNVPVKDLQGENAIYAVVKLADGTVLKMESANTTSDVIYVGAGASEPSNPPAEDPTDTPEEPQPPMADASLVVFVLAAAAIALVVLKKKAF